MPGVVHLDDSVVENLMSFQIEVVPMNDRYDVVRRLRVDHQTAQKVPFHFDVLRRSRAENAGVDCGDASFFRVFFRFVCHSEFNILQQNVEVKRSRKKEKNCS